MLLEDWVMVNLVVRFLKMYVKAVLMAVKIAAVVAAIFMAIALAEYAFSQNKEFSDPEFLVLYWPMMPIASLAIFVLMSAIGGIISLLYAADVVSRGADLPRVPRANTQLACVNAIFDSIIEANKK